MQRRIEPPNFTDKPREQFLEEQIQDWLFEVQAFLEAEGFKLVWKIIPEKDLEIRMEDLKGSDSVP